MKRTFLIILLILTFINSNAQKLYKEIPAKKIETEKVNYAKEFISKFLEKCENKSNSDFPNFKITGYLQKFLIENLEKVCTNNQKVYGKIELKTINSIYNDRYSNLYNPSELYIFDVNTEKNKDIKFISIWMTQNEKIIEGIWISIEKPLKRKEYKYKNEIK